MTWDCVHHQQFISHRYVQAQLLVFEAYHTTNTPTATYSFSSTTPTLRARDRPIPTPQGKLKLYEPTVNDERPIFRTNFRSTQTVHPCHNINREFLNNQFIFLIFIFLIDRQVSDHFSTDRWIDVDILRHEKTTWLKRKMVQLASRSKLTRLYVNQVSRARMQ